MTQKNDTEIKRIDHNRGVVLIALSLGYFLKMALDASQTDLKIAFIFIVMLGVGLCMLWVE